MLQEFFAKIPDLDSYLNIPRVIYEKKVEKHPQIVKIVLVVDHLFRLLSMIGMMEKLPFSTSKKCSIIVAGSLLYAISVERFCPLRFTVLACFGSFAFTLAKANQFKLIYSLPLAFYAISVIKTVYFPEKQKEFCCKPEFELK